MLNILFDCPTKLHQKGLVLLITARMLWSTLQLACNSSNHDIEYYQWRIGDDKEEGGGIASETGVCHFWERGE